MLSLGARAPSPASAWTKEKENVFWSLSFRRSTRPATHCGRGRPRSQGSKKATAPERELHPGLAAFFEEPTYLDCVNVLVLERFQNPESDLNTWRAVTRRFIGSAGALARSV